jgi:lipopolysaccharide transport system ATP-binding protein
MGTIAIRTAGLGKRYSIGARQRTSDRLGEWFVDAVRAPARRAMKILRGNAEGAADLESHIWALRNVNLEINHGEVVGIIGRNGAGKTTFLKILSRITEPSEGYADLFGRVGSLLEVGTGFHPELTGRENIYLNGAMLGMGKLEIRSKFDEIVEFAQIPEFLDTPVKHYSSGMYVRLAFAVAAHLDPEILLIDEVLAVGDAAFQKKCLGKMGDVAQEGRTVLFVSHNMGLIQSICQRGVLLEDGQVRADGPVAETINAYLQSISNAELQELSGRTDRKGLGQTRLQAVEILSDQGSITDTIPSGTRVTFTMRLDRLVPGINCNISLYDHLGLPVAVFKSKMRGPEDSERRGPAGGSGEVVCEIEELFLLPGRYRMDVAIIGENRIQDFVEAAATFDVVEGSIRGRSAMADRRFRVQFPHRWIMPRN